MDISQGSQCVYAIFVISIYFEWLLSQYEDSTATLNNGMKWFIFISTSNNTAVFLPNSHQSAVCWWWWNGGYNFRSYHLPLSPCLATVCRLGSTKLNFTCLSWAPPCLSTSPRAVYCTVWPKSGRERWDETWTFDPPARMVLATEVELCLPHGHPPPPPPPPPVSCIASWAIHC